LNYPTYQGKRISEGITGYRFLRRDIRENT
jgi:hypothetical protein